jgi:hypothetical protein
MSLLNRVIGTARQAASSTGTRRRRPAGGRPTAGPTARPAGGARRPTGNGGRLMGAVRGFMRGR